MTRPNWYQNYQNMGALDHVRLKTDPYLSELIKLGLWEQAIIYCGQHDMRMSYRELLGWYFIDIRYGYEERYNYNPHIFHVSLNSLVSRKKKP